VVTLGIPDGEVHLWYDVLEDEPADGRRRAAKNIVSAEDRDRCGRLPGQKERKDCLTARWMLRSILSQYVPAIGPSEWRFGDAADGRSRVVAPAAMCGLHFNLSWVDGIVACAVSGHYEVGVAVRRIERRPGVRVAETGLSPTEAAALTGLAPADRTRRLLEYWTLKEAFAKARGTSHTVPPHRLSFDIGRQGRPSATFAPEVDDEEAAWQFDRLFIGTDHIVALATRRGPVPTVAVVVRAFEPT
jgi:4'-phosphopantetheinyl transferase